MTSAPSTATRRAPEHRHRRDADPARLPTATGILAVLAGAAWVSAALVHASQPAGCVGDACAGAPMRESTTATAVLVGLAALFMLVSGFGLLLVVRRAGRLGWTGATGAALCAAGAATLALAVTLQELVADGDFEWMPWFVGPGVLLLAVGAVLVGWTVVRSPAVPHWVGASLIVGAALFALSHEQTAAVLLTVPFGVAWAAMGVVLVLRPHTGGKSRNDVR